MAKRVLTEKVANLAAFAAVRSAGVYQPFTPQVMAHLYVKLDFLPNHENASTADAAKGFLSSVSRASFAAQRIADSHNGLLLEVQGSTLHIGLLAQPNINVLDGATACASDLHWAYRAVFPDHQKRVQGWRMTLDCGKTLLVTGRGVHGDDSLVSLGTSANRPAKHLYAQLEKPEDERDLKRFHLGRRRESSLPTSTWDHFDLDRMKSRLLVLEKIAADARSAKPQLDFIEATTGWQRVTARALPLEPAGSPGSPTPDKPHTYFGWVMRADLDGFTKKVQNCLDKDEKLQELAEEFYCLMDAAAEFAQRHKETLAQLPWAGDNFTAAAVFSTKGAYEAAIPKRLVELTLDFEKDMADAAVECGFGGWAHGIAGGEVHASASGNVYLAGIEIDGRRFLVGVGEGFGRSTRAFADVDPHAEQIVVYKPDWERMYEGYKRAFEPAPTRRKEQSTLYWMGHADGLRKVRALDASATMYTPVPSASQQPRIIPTRPHFR